MKKEKVIPVYPSMEEKTEAKNEFLNRFGSTTDHMHMADKYGLIGVGIGMEGLVCYFDEEIHKDIPDEINGIKINKTVIGKINALRRT